MAKRQREKDLSSLPNKRAASGQQDTSSAGQRDSDCLFKGFGETSRIAGSNSAHVELDLAEEHQYESDSSCWCSQQGSGCFVEEISNRSRLDVESHGLFVDRSEMGSYGNRSFCRPDEHEVSNISVLGPGSELSGSGCSPSRLGAVPSSLVLLASMASDSSLSGQVLDSTVYTRSQNQPFDCRLVLPWWKEAVWFPSLRLLDPEFLLLPQDVVIQGSSGYFPISEGKVMPQLVVARVSHNLCAI